MGRIALFETYTRRKDGMFRENIGERETIHFCQCHCYEEPKNLRDLVNNTDEVIKVVKGRIDDVDSDRLWKIPIHPCKRVYPTINGKDIRHYLITQKERQRCAAILNTTKKPISPYYLLYRCIRTGKIRYKGIFLRDYFSSNEQYSLAVERIKSGWTVERAIEEKGIKYSFRENGLKGSEALRIKLGLKTRGQAMAWLARKGLA